MLFSKYTYLAGLINQLFLDLSKILFQPAKNPATQRQNDTVHTTERNVLCARNMTSDIPGGDSIIKPEVLSAVQ